MRYLVEHGAIGVEALMSIAGCNNIRTLQNDLSLLRDEFMVDISFSRKRGRYEMRNAGRFLIDIGASQIELDALAVGLRLSGAIPYFKEASSSIWVNISSRLSHLFGEVEPPSR